MPERFDGIIHSAAIGFISANREGRMPGNGQLEHVDPQCGGRQLPIAFVRRHGGGQKPQGIQAALLPAALGQKQMAVMHGIESSAEEAKFSRDPKGSVRG
jgi:hypothetical protein